MHEGLLALGGLRGLGFRVWHLLRPDVIIPLYNRGNSLEVNPHIRVIEGVYTGMERTWALQ